MILFVSTANCVTVEPEVTSEISADCRGKVSTSARKSSDYLSKQIAENIKKTRNIVLLVKQERCTSTRISTLIAFRSQ